MTDIYLHGIQTIEKSDGPRPVAAIDTGIIGMAYTAPDASETLWPLNTLIPIYGYNGFPSGLGSSGTGPAAFEGIFDQATRASQTVVSVRVNEGANIYETMSNIIGNPLTMTGIHAFRRAENELFLKPKLLIAPGFTSLRPTDGVKSITVTDGGSSYETPPTVVITGVGHGAKAEAIIDSASGEVTEVVVLNPGGGYTSPPTVTFTGGGGADATATAVLGQVANPVAVEMLTIANRLRAGVIVDAPNTTSTAAVAYRMDFDTDRMLICEPFVKVFRGGANINEPGSARVAGLQAKIDYEEGFWVSPSNHIVEGIVGTARPIEHTRSDPSSESQFLNKNSVACFVRAPSGGFKLWGSRVPSSDNLKKFWSVRRAHDTIIESIEIAHEPFVDKPFSIQNLVSIGETVNTALRKWKALGATLGGNVWLDETLNTAATWADGKLYVSYDAEGPAPMEQITFIFNRNTGYYDELAADAAREIARLSGNAS